MWDIGTELTAIRAADLHRQRRVYQADGPVHMVDASGRRLLNFCGNDYLGLANDPRLGRVLRDWSGPTGSGSADLVTGHRYAHEALSEALSDWLQRDRTLLFSTGYMANLGVIAGLTRRGDLVLQDRLNHASLIDGGLLSGARCRRYRHRDVDHLQRCLDRPYRRRLVATDGVFSMDGDIAPLAEIAAVTAQTGAALLVDDAHGLGVIGSQGRGSLADAGLDQFQVPLLVGTFGKAFGTYGAFVSGPAEWIELLEQKARTAIYTTASPPVLSAATLAALDLVRTEGWRRERLAALIRRFRVGASQLGLSLGDSGTAIQPVIIGEAGAALAASRRLEVAGILVAAIRPPTVPAGSARLRITLSAAHADEHLDRLLDALDDPELRDSGRN